MFLNRDLKKIGYFKIIDCNIRGIVSVNCDSKKLWAKSKGIISIGELKLAQYTIEKKYEITDRYNNLLRFNPE